MTGNGAHHVRFRGVCDVVPNWFAMPGLNSNYLGTSNGSNFNNYVIRKSGKDKRERKHAQKNSR
ncbi:unnamed protein product, partial [Nesidiocoris tenuis]